jgi:hypothetical protein
MLDWTCRSSRLSSEPKSKPDIGNTANIGIAYMTSSCWTLRPVAEPMQYSPRIDNPAEWDIAVSRSLEDYRSGRLLMDHLGAIRLIEPATTGMLLAIRRGLIEETNATSIAEYMLVDMAVTAFASSMRLESIVSNTSLIIEGELFGQPTLRAKWQKAHDGRPAEIKGLAVEEHVAFLRDRLLPLAERFHRMGRESIDALARMRQVPALSVERAGAITIVLATPQTDRLAQV